MSMARIERLNGLIAECVELGHYDAARRLRQRQHDLIRAQVSQQCTLPRVNFCSVTGIFGFVENSIKKFSTGRYWHSSVFGGLNDSKRV